MKPRVQSSREVPQTDRFVAQAILLSGGVAVAVALGLIGSAHWDLKTKITIALPLVGFWLGFAFAALRRLDRSLRTLGNILLSLREGDYSLRARAKGNDDPLSDLTREVNRFSDELQERRRAETEATHLLTTVLQEVDVALLAIDGDHRIRLANPAALQLLGVSDKDMLGRPIRDFALEECLEGEPARMLSRTFPGKTGRWGMRRSTFFSDGKPHVLLVIADLSRTLREEELGAWQRLVRVLGHEINNSLTPIKSIAGSLRDRVAPGAVPSDGNDLADGLEIIESRAASLSRFIDAYARLARLPVPAKQPVRVSSLFSRIQSMDTRIRVAISIGDPNIEVHADPGLLEQVLINLTRNAVDAALAAHETAPSDARVTLCAETGPGVVRLLVIDNGLGPPDSVNLFVPFFTTKPGGSGIGLVLSRQIAESHGGTLALERRTGAPGCVAVVTLPH